MKAATVLAVTFAALAQAQTRADIPSCALPCLDAAVTANTKCSTTDYACICKDFSAVQTSATSCVIEKCGADVALNKVLPATQALCKAQSGSGSSAAASSSAAATSAAATSAPASSAPASSAPASSAPATSAAQTSAAATTSAAGTTIVTSSTPAGTGAPPAGNRTTTGPTHAPTNAGPVVLPGLAMLALGALAL
ncbi:hypothetical protein M441DRAFT_62699 [Trichoderma asperellum CBS 433.97]|uniref:CFEM domain-containing protein n=1 Tax=Trichoderma asperellum (strain ATCC 204424 / CBS 433.97 / NBRC 101777) TaxID=1042311 RepID=A0A2T3YSW1_TRIA4|nr:hypothetical protein M441DRAFT_62699 [Trichoderma asperellum CBS 433.97]PTB35655.1 hypothetical protein M441DRAFT_62699 [Trichoderma asperellum CBS 433.97]